MVKLGHFYPWRKQSTRQQTCLLERLQRLPWKAHIRFLELIDTQHQNRWLYVLTSKIMSETQWGLLWPFVMLSFCDIQAFQCKVFPSIEVTFLSQNWIFFGPLVRARQSWTPQMQQLFYVFASRCMFGVWQWELFSHSFFVKNKNKYLHRLNTKKGDESPSNNNQNRKKKGKKHLHNSQSGSGFFTKRMLAN